MQGLSAHHRPGRRRLLVAALLLPAATGLHAADYPEISWDDLVPKDWDPMKSFQDMPNLGMLQDTDPRAQQFLQRLRDEWDNAPTVESMAGRSVKLPGYLVPLEEGRDGIREFLLVPYFGACIHTPPPPANQIILVRAAKPVKGMRTMEPVWVQGTLGVARVGSSMGVSGYTMDARSVVRH
jgi:uncharacterized protein